MQPLAFTNVSSAHLLTLLDTIDEGIFAFDKEWHYIYLNQAAANLVQRAREELIGQNIWQRTPELAHSRFYIEMHRAVQENRTISMEAFYPHLNTWLESNICPSPEGITVVSRDISERKRSEEALKTSEERLHLAVDAAQLGLWFCDLPFDELIWDTKVKEHFWLSADIRVTMDTFYERIHPDDRLRTEQAINQSIEQHDQYDIEYRTLSETGQIKWIRAIGKTFYDEAGTPKRFDGVTLDITDKKETAAALRRSELYLKRLFEAKVIGIVTADRNYILDANDAFLNMLGYSREELQEHKINWPAITPAEYEPIDQYAIQELQENDTCTPFEKEYYRKDGSRQPVLIGAATIQEHPSQWVCFILDISAQKTLEQRRDDFISIASHELKTPLTSLKGFTRLLSYMDRDRLQPERQETILQKMEQQIDRLTHLITDLLDVSKIQSGQLEYIEAPIAIDAFIKDIVEDMQQTTTTHKIVLHGTTEVVILGDAERLCQVFNNLMSNAIKYSPQAQNVDIYLSRSADAITVQVRDYGMGIPTTQQDKIFERFYRVSSENRKYVPGLGMGLYITQEIVKRHGGTISVESQEGQGSTFSVTLPIQATPQN